MAVPPLQYDATVPPTTDHQYSTTGTFASDGTSVLTIEMGDTFSDATELTGIRLNAFVIGADSSFAITDLAYDSDAHTVALTWQAQSDTTYIARYSTDLLTWRAAHEGDITSADDEILDDGDRITATLPLTDGLENETDLFFRVERN